MDTSDAAIDDIEIENGACYPEASCEFEDDYCGFYNTREGDDFDWERAKGRKNDFTGPQVDHTTGTIEGYYALINPLSSYPEGKYNVYFVLHYFTFNLDRIIQI